MKRRVLSIAIMLCSCSVFLYAQESDTTKREVAPAENSAGTSSTQQQSGQEDETELLGEENIDANENQNEGNTSSDYRNNEVTGNPNNTSIEGGSNRRSGEGETDESSGAVKIDSTNTGSSSSGEGVKADPNASNAPAVTHKTSSQSGSPAVLSDDKGEGRDGTNNVQRAEPNMAGSPVDGMRYSGREVNDANHEMRERSLEQQAEPKPRTAQQRNRQIRENAAAKDSVRGNDMNPHPDAMGTLPGNQEQATDGNSQMDSTQQEGASSSEKSSKKKKWWQLRKKGKDQ